MVQHEVYYVSTQRLANGGMRTSSPNAGHSKIRRIELTFYADVEKDKRVSFSVYFYVRDGKAYFDIDDFWDEFSIAKGKVVIRYEGEEILEPYIIANSIKK